MLLENKVCVVTGGTSGIGLGTVERFVEFGARVVIGDIQDERGREIADRLGPQVRYVRADVTREDDIEGLVAAAVEHFGRLDVMFNNAGDGGDRAGMTEVGAEGFDRTMSVLARSVLLGHKYAARRFIEQGGGGSIISTASAAGIEGGWSSAAYTVAKHAVVGVVHQAVAELAQYGIRSNAISPGVIATPIMTRTFGVPMEQNERFLDFLSDRIGHTQPIGRLGRPRDIAGAAVFFASDLSEYVTGVNLSVDGGATAVTQGSFAEDVVAAAAEFPG